MTDLQTKPTTIRDYAFKLLPVLCRVLAQERGAYINNTDAISIAVKEAIERRIEPLRANGGEKEGGE